MVPTLLWKRSLMAMMVVGMAAIAVIGALAGGWNTPRPNRPPDRRFGTRQLALETETISQLLGEDESNFVLEVIALPLHASESELYEVGLVYRAQDARHYYALAVGTDGYYSIVRAEGGNLTRLVEWNQFPHILRGLEANRLLVTCDGPTCTFRINDEYVTDVTDDRWLSGDVGLWARSTDGKLLVQYRSVDLWSLAD